MQQEQQRTELGIQQLLGQRSQTKNNIPKLLKSKQDTLDSLTATQQQQVLAGTLGGGGTTSGTYTGPTGTQADTAVAFVYKQLGCPYVYGGTGPCSARVRLLRARAGRLGGGGHLDPARHLRAVGRAAARLRVVDRARGPAVLQRQGHVAMYVGGGYIIDAPSTGYAVEKIPMSTAWYADSFDGAARP